MNIAVCISSVPDTTSKIEFVNNNTEFDKNNIQFVINPYDEFGLTKAMMLKESTGAKVTVITVGLADVEPVMRKALAIGADEAIRINFEPKESQLVACEIAKYLKDKSFDLIITGKESIDYNGSIVPGMIAEILNLPFVNACIGLDLNENEVIATREIDGGKEILKTSLPLVIGGQKGLVYESELRIPNMRGIMTARTKPLSVIEPGDLSEKVISNGFKKPTEKAACKLIDSGNVKELVDLLRNEAKVI